MSGQLERAVGVPGAVLMGLGSILGTGIFVSVGIAAGIAGSAVVIAIALAAVIAICNGLSSAQLAASHPVSGGTYEYGYRYLNAPLGFTAGWLFLCAKSASAATAALGFAQYLALDSRVATIGIAVALVAVLTAIVAGGITRSSRTNAVIVGATLLGLAAFVVAGIPSTELVAIDDLDARDLLHATALVFVAYTGYGRIATLGEEVRAPQRTIPRAVVVALAITCIVYIAVTVVAIGTAGAAAYAAAGTLPSADPTVRTIVAIAAVTAMAGVLLNLILGLSRVVLAMGRRGDMPPALARLDAKKSPRAAIAVTGVAIAGLVMIGNVKTTWSFSAFTVLVYYAITNLAALRLPREHRRFPRAVAGLGLASCLGLAFWVEPAIWLAGLGVIILGLGWHLGVARRWRRGIEAK